MRDIIKFEVIKFFRKTKNKILISLLLIFILFININNYNSYINHDENTIEEYKKLSAETKASIDNLNSVLSAYAGLSEEVKLKDQEQILKYERELEYLRPEASVINRISNVYKKAEEPEWNKILCKYYSERYTNMVTSYENGYIDDQYLMERKINIEEVKYNKMKYDYLLENDIILKYNEYKPSGAYSLSLLLKENNILIIISIIGLLSMDIFLSAVVEGSYKLEYTQPFERKKIFVSKLIGILLIILMILILIVGLNFIINSMFFGIGSFSYPEFVSKTINKLTLQGSEGEFIAITLGYKLIMGLLIVAVFIFSTISLITFLSLFTDSLEKTLGVFSILTITAFTLKTIVSKNSIANLIYPYMYYFYENVVSGFYRYNYPFGIVINFSLGVIFTVLSYYKFLSKDFLGSRE